MLISRGLRLCMLGISVFLPVPVSAQSSLKNDFARCRDSLDDTKSVLLCSQYISRSKNESATARAQAYGKRGFANYNLNKLSDAIKDYSEAIRLNPNDASYLVYRGSIYTNKKQFELAIADMSGAVRLSPNDAANYSERGSVYLEKGDYDLAIADYSEAIRLKPQDGDAFWGRSLVHERKGDFDRALADGLRWRALDPSNQSGPEVIARLMRGAGKGKIYGTITLVGMDYRTGSRVWRKQTYDTVYLTFGTMSGQRADKEATGGVDLSRPFLISANSFPGAAYSCEMFAGSAIVYSASGTFSKSYECFNPKVSKTRQHVSTSSTLTRNGNRWSFAGTATIEGGWLSSTYTYAIKETIELDVDAEKGTCRLISYKRIDDGIESAKEGAAMPTVTKPTPFQTVTTSVKTVCTLS